MDKYTIVIEEREDGFYGRIMIGDRIQEALLFPSREEAYWFLNRYLEKRYK